MTRRCRPGASSPRAGCGAGFLSMAPFGENAGTPDVPPAPCPCVHVSHISVSPGSQCCSQTPSPPGRFRLLPSSPAWVSVTTCPGGPMWWLLPVVTCPVHVPTPLWYPRVTLSCCPCHSSVTWPPHVMPPSLVPHGVTEGQCPHVSHGVPMSLWCLRVPVSPMSPHITPMSSCPYAVSISPVSPHAPKFPW